VRDVRHKEFGQGKKVRAMVKYVLTPWWDLHELLQVRKWFYPGRAGDEREGSSRHDDGRQTQRRAIARVAIWMERGNCPYMVEATALLMSAILLDQDVLNGDKNLAEGSKGGQIGQDAASEYAVRSAYSTAFSRFVTGLLDSQQDKQRKMNMFVLAKEISLPAAFVELRHEATHHHLPPLARLRPAAQKAMGWIWVYYWRDVMPKGVAPPTEPLDPCRDSVVAFLETAGDKVGTDEAVAEALRALVSSWGEERIQSILIQLQRTACGNRDTRLMLRAARLAHRVLSGFGQVPPTDGRVGRVRDINEVRADLDRWRRRLEELPGEAVGSERTGESDDEDGDFWEEYKGPWGPRPIGCV
jgi:ribosomal biogenesis protein LAS1